MIARHAGSSFWVSVFCLWLLRPGEAQAQTITLPVGLDLTAVAGCPNASELQALVAARLGYDPFSGAAQSHVSVRITAQGEALDGRTEWRNAAGKWLGDQSFHLASPDCLRLARTIGLALAVQLQLSADASVKAEPETSTAPRTETEPPPATTVQPLPKLPRTDSPTKAQPKNAPGHLRAAEFALGAGAAVGFGMASTPILLGRAFGQLSWPHLSLQLGPELSAPTSTRRGDGAGFSQQLLMMSAAGCWLLSPWNACLVFNAGQVRMMGQDIDRPASARVPVIEAGVRVGLQQPVGRFAFLSAHLDGLAVIVRRTGSLDGIPVWTAPPVAAAIGLDVGLRFP